MQEHKLVQKCFHINYPPIYSVCLKSKERWYLISKRQNAVLIKIIPFYLCIPIFYLTGIMATIRAILWPLKCWILHYFYMVKKGGVGWNTHVVLEDLRKEFFRLNFSVFAQQDSDTVCVIQINLLQKMTTIIIVAADTHFSLVVWVLPTLYSEKSSLSYHSFYAQDFSSSALTLGDLVSKVDGNA